MLKRGTVKCPNDKEPLYWHQYGGMRLYREITPPKPKHVYTVFDAKCPTCNEEFEVKR